MKIRMVIYLSILFVGLGLFFYLMRSKIGVYDAVTKTVSPNTYCNQFSGTVSAAWGKDTSDICVKKGCMVLEKVEFGKNDNIFDNDGFTYKCVPKK